jgi:hypothetical protein
MLLRASRSIIRSTRRIRTPVRTGSGSLGFPASKLGSNWWDCPQFYWGRLGGIYTVKTGVKSVGRNILGTLIVLVPVAALADAPISQDQYPIGGLCVADGHVALSQPFCVFDEKDGAWRCDLPSSPCPVVHHPFYNPSNLILKNTGANRFSVTFKNETCPTVSIQTTDLSRPFGACNCAVWIAACDSNACASPHLLRVDSATTAIFRPSDVGAKSPMTKF